MRALLRSLLWTDPAFFALTAFLGSLSLAASLFDGTGRLQHRIAQRWARMVMRLIGVEVAVSGQEHIRPGQPYVFCANHLSLIDTPLMFGYLPADFRILARKGLFSIPFLGWHLRRAGHLPVARDDARAGLRSLTEAAARVAQGVSVVVFPQGQRSPDGTAAFKPGAAYVAIKAGVPLAPIGITGTQQIHAIGSPTLHPGRVGLRIGRPIPTTGMSPREARALMEAVKDAIQDLIVQHQVIH